MSTYIVDDQTINRILTQLSLENSSWFISKVQEKTGYNTTFDDDLNSLGKELLLLNTQAVNERYDDNNSGNDVIAYTYHPDITSKIQAYKSLNCLLYQCSEGDVPKTELYSFLNWLAFEWADDLVRSMPAYEQADWR